MFWKKFSNILLLILVILLPFWDLIVQKVIKTYHQVFNLTEIIIFDYPQRDENEKIESIGFSLTGYIDVKNIELSNSD